MEFSRRNNQNRCIGEESIAVGLHHASSPTGKFELEGSNRRMNIRKTILSRPQMQRQVRGDCDQIGDAKAIDGHLPGHCPILPFGAVVQPCVPCVISCNKVISKGSFSIHAVPSRTKIPARLRFHARSNQAVGLKGGLDLFPFVRASIIRKGAVAYQSNVGLEIR